MGERLEGRQGDQFRDGEHNPSRRSGGSDQGVCEESGTESKVQGMKVNLDIL